MDSQVSKKRTESPSRRHFCSSCQKEIKPNTGSLCSYCENRLKSMEKEKPDHSFSPDENNLVYNIVKEFKLLLSLRVQQLSDTLTHERELVSICRNIFKSERTTHVFFYFCKYGAATAQVLQVQLSMNYQVVYRVMKSLSNMGIIHPVRKIRKHARGQSGPRYEVWGIYGVDKVDVADCIKLHRRCISPKYRLAEEILPTILDEYIYKRNVDEVTRRELIQYVKDSKLVTFNAYDIVELAIPIIESKGIKVWR